MEKNKEFENMVKVKELPQEKAKLAPIITGTPVAPSDGPPPSTTPSVQGKIQKAAVPAVGKSLKQLKRQPDIEDSAGFIGRRPAVDPFVVGEKVTLALTYFNMAAGYLTLETKPFVEVNGKKSYHFKISAQSSKMFSYVYEVDDWAETFVDYHEMVPYTMGINVKESKQLKEIQSFFDFKKMLGQYWETKVTSNDGTSKKKKKTWSILPYTQNVISAAFYMRTFSYEVDKSLAFRVGDAGKNLVFTAKVLRREKLNTEIGEINTIVIQPKITIDGLFKQVGEILIWMTDDDRKHIVRIESKIKIGTIIGKLKSIEYL